MMSLLVAETATVPGFAQSSLLRCMRLLGWSTLLACIAGPAASQGNAKLALVIGNAAYENVPVLKNPVNDAEDMCAALRRLGFETMCYTNLRSRDEFQARVGEYVERLGPATVGVVYYSGHGLQANNANYLIPTHVEPAAVGDPLAALYGVDELFGHLAQKPTQLQLVILDACRTDLFAVSPGASNGRGANVVADTSLVRALSVVPSVASGLGPIKDAPPETIVLYATASRDTAFDGEGRNGPLTKHVLRHIRTRGLFLQDFIGRVIAGVQRETSAEYGKRQTPFQYGSFGGKFCFAGCPGEGSVPIIF